MVNNLKTSLEVEEPLIMAKRMKEGDVVDGGESLHCVHLNITVGRGHQRETVWNTLAS